MSNYVGGVMIPQRMYEEVAAWVYTTMLYDDYRWYIEDFDYKLVFLKEEDYVAFKLRFPVSAPRAD
jgi:hypothetical protein